MPKFLEIHFAKEKKINMDKNIEDYWLNIISIWKIK